ncbi:MAG: hypothetical protein ACRELX_16370, partial [Longimicrobiales bacterium]
AEQLRRTCHQSLGRDASGYVGQDPDKTRELCRLDRSPYAPWCYIGAVKAITDWTGTPDAGFAFCAAVAEEPARIRCYEAVGEQIGIMLDVPAARQLACSTADGYRDVCLFGAREIAEKPALLRDLDPGG